MPAIARRNSEAQLLGSTDHLFYDDRNFCAEWYDHTGGQTFTLGNAAQTLNLDTEKVNVAPEVFSIASDVVTIADAGLYFFSFQMMVAQNGGSSSVVNRVWLEQDPNTGTFAISLPAVSYFPVAPISLAVGTAVVSTVLLVGIDYKYRLRFTQDFGSSPMRTVADGSKLTIIRLFKNG